MTYREAYNKGIQLLKEAGNSESEIDSFYLLEYATGITRSMYYLDQNCSVDDEKCKLYMNYIERACGGEPVDYIIGTRSFYGLDFKVNKHVLIPRQDTEHLVEMALTELKKAESVSYLDLCTGSGCIAVTIAHELFKHGVIYKATASDISEDALLVATENAKRNNVDVTFIHSDMFENITGQFDLIVSNPPYIPDGEISNLEKKVTEHEPHIALFGGKDGLDFYKIIVKECKSHLTKNGMLMLEIGYDQGESVPALLSKEGYKNIKVIKDYNGLDRVVVGMI